MIHGAINIVIIFYSQTNSTPVMTLLCAFRVTDSVMDLTRLLLPEPDIPISRREGGYLNEILLFEVILEDGEFAEGSSNC